jgi:hypothetical protein
MAQTDILQQLKQLDSSSPLFPDMLTSLLFKKEYKECIPTLRDEDVVWLVDYLDGVCLSCPSSLLCLFLNIHRFLNLFKSIHPTPCSEDVYVNSGGSVVPDNGFPSRTYSRVLFQTSANTHSPLENLVMFTKVS